MSLSDTLSRRTFLKGGLALSALAFAGCGFTPAYGPNGGAKALLGLWRRKCRKPAMITRSPRGSLIGSACHNAALPA